MHAVMYVVMISWYTVCNCNIFLYNYANMCTNVCSFKYKIVHKMLLLPK